MKEEQHIEQQARKEKSTSKRSDDYDQQYGWQTLENETEEGNYYYWLQEHDIVHIARVEFGYGEGYRKVGYQTQISEETESGKVFYDKTSSKTVFVVSDLSSLPKKLANFKDYVNGRNELRTLTTVIYMGGGHWVTLVVANENGQYYAYYSDSLGSEIIPDVKRELENKVEGSIYIMDLNVKQQEDVYNCGVFALENAHLINEALQQNKRLDEIIEKLRYKFTDQELKERRKCLVENLLKDHERRRYVIVNFATMNSVKTSLQLDGPDLNTLDEELLRMSLDLNGLLKSSIEKQYLEIATFAVEKGADTSDLSFDNKKDLSDYIRKHRIERIRHILDFLSTVSKVNPNPGDSELEKTPGLSVDRVKGVDDNPNQAGSSDVSIDTLQHQQVNPNSPDFVDSDDERVKHNELFSAIRNGKLPELQELLKAGVKVYIIDKNNKDNTPLHYGIERGKKEIAEKLLQEWKADINAKNNKGDTPLHIATSRGNKELVKLLVKNGAKIDVKNYEGRTPLNIAKHLKRQDIVQILVPQIQPTLRGYDEEQPPNRQQLQENIRSESNSGQGYSVQSSNQQWKADINAKDSKGDTPLNTATSRDNKELMQLLVKNGAKIDVKNDEDRTPLDSKHLEKQDIVQVLVPQIQPNLCGYDEEQPPNRLQLQENIRSESNSGQGYSAQSSNQQKKLTSEKNSGKHKIPRRSGTTGGIDGNFYEIDLSIIGKLRGDRDTNKFYLATNVDGLGAFDDVVIRYWENNGKEEKSTTILLQAKHVDDSKKGKVTIEKFKNPKNDKFYLGKYFLDYLNSREKFNDKSTDPVFRGNFQVRDIKYIIYTNAILYEQFDKNRKIDIDKICIFSTKSKEDNDKAFKFSLDGKNCDVIATLESVSCQERVKLLAKALVSCITGKLNYNYMMGNKFFSTYHVFLAKNVIDVGEEIKIDSNKIKYREGKINHDFLNIDNKDLFKKVLKKEVLYEYAKDVMFDAKSSSGLDDVSKRDVLVNKVIKSLESSGIVDEDVIEKFGGSIIILDTIKKQLKFADPEKMMDESSKQIMRHLKSKFGELGKYKFDIPYELVKKTLKEKEILKLHDSFGNVSPSFKKPEHLIKKLIELFEKYESSKIIKIDDTVVGHGKDLTVGDIKNIGKLVGNLLIFDKKKKMLRLASKRCINGDTLKFITNLKSAARPGDLKIFSYGFDIKVKNFPRETLVTDDEDRTNVEEFLSKLEVFTGQANDKELKGIIKDEIRNLYKLTVEEVEESFLKIRNKAEEHWREGEYYLEKDDDFFTNIVKFNIEFDLKEPVHLFSGRVKELSDLHKIQHSSKTVISQMTSICGLGGIGKTELARKYAYDHGRDYDGNVVWINAKSYQDSSKSFLRLAQDKLGINVKIIEGNENDIKSIVEDVYGFFSKRKCLFIFDNAEKYRTQDDGDEGIDKFLPSFPSNINKTYVLITSQNQKWGNIRVIRLDTLTEKEATDFLKKALNIEDDSQENDIQKLAKTLQYFPLALQLAVAYIKVKDVELKNTGSEFKISNYLKRYEKETEELLKFPFPKDSSDLYTETTFTTLKITIDKIKYNLEYGNLAADILDIVAYTASDNISVKMFLGLERDRERLGNAIELLKQYSMISSGEEQSSVNVHRLVQQVLRISLKDRDKEVLRRALKLFQNGSRQVDLFDYNIRLNNVDHAISVWKYANKHEELVREFSSLPVLIVSELNATMQYQEAYLFGSNALKLLEKILSNNHLSVLAMMKSIASVLLTQGKYNDSLKMSQKLKQKSDFINKLIMPEVCLFDTNIGLILNKQGKHDEALEIFSHQYSLVKEGIINSDGSIEHNLAVTLFEKKKFDEAIEMYENALQRKKELLGSDDPSTLNTENSMCLVLEMQGKYEEALKKCRKVYEKREKILGSDHPDTLTTYHNFAQLLTRLERYDEALKIANEVNKEREKLFPDHPRTLKGKYTIAAILQFQGKYDEALEKFKVVYEKRKKILGSNDPDTLITLSCLYELALRFAKQRKYDKALKELNNVLEERKKISKSSKYLQSISELKDVISKVRRAQRNGADFNLKVADPGLLRAAEKGQLEVVNKLLDESADVNVEAITGHTPLYLATENDHARVVEKLLEKGAEVNAKTEKGSTALHIAAHRNYLDVVNVLLKGGADVNCYDNALFRPLHFAAQEGHAKIIELLLENGAEIEATTIGGLTPLYMAACHKNLNVVKILLEGGANIDADSEYMILIDESIEKVLLSTKQLPNAIRQKHNKSDIQRLLEDGAVINYFSDTSRKTSLHYAVSRGDLDIVVLLVGEKVDVNVADEDGWTPLHYAAQDGHLDIVKLLLDHQANPNVQTSNGKTPLDLAAEKLSQNPQIYQEIINTLESKLLCIRFESVLVL